MATHCENKASLLSSAVVIHLAMTLKFSSGQLYNSSKSIEGSFVELLSKEINGGKEKIWTIGPLHQTIISENRAEKSLVLEWLDQQEPNSVLYISFGTTVSFSEDEIEELAFGLEQSGVKFIWVLRDADEIDVSSSSYEEGRKGPKLPDGFEERVKGMGMVVREWVPQVEILGHSSTGGFMSHCGWNSCMESLSMGVPMVAWPMHSDQPMNGLLITELLKVGVGVIEWSQREELITSSMISRGVRRIMGSDSEEGDEIRKRAVEIGVAVKRSVVEGVDLWKPGKGMYVKILEQNWFLFQFYPEIDIQRVITGSPWTSMIYRLVSKLKGLFVKQIITLECFESDPNNFQGIWREYLRVRVRLNVGKPLKRRMKFKKKNGDVFNANFKYERVPTFCFICGIMGHSERFCSTSYDTITKPYSNEMRAPSKRQSFLTALPWLCTGKPAPSSAGSNNLPQSPTFNAMPQFQAEITSPTRQSNQTPATKVIFQQSILNSRHTAQGRKGGLAFLWKISSDAHLLKFSAHHIDMEVHIPSYDHWRLTGFYGEPNRSLRHTTWELLRDLADDSNLPWCIIGDFNNITTHEDKKGGRLYPESLINGFNAALHDCRLCELQLRGHRYTWERGRGTQNHIEIRLDKAFATQSWLTIFNEASLLNFDFSSSDHTPIFLEPAPAVMSKPITILRYKNAWSREPLCGQIVRNCWEANVHLSLVDKTKLCLETLIDWGRDLTGHFKKRLSNINGICRSVTAEQNDSLLCPITAEEVKQAIFQMHPDKAPGPNGMNPDFYQKHWDTVGKLISDNIMIGFEIMHYLKRKTKGKKGFMAMKLDMSKAYDRVEWDYLYAVMHRFSSLIKKFEDDHVIQGCRVAKGAPPITHMLFADDSYLFCQASPNTAVKIKQMLHSVELASGQKVNVSKSFIFFSPNNEANHRNQICIVLVMTEATNGSLYLGLPNIIGRKKTVILGFLKNKIINCLNSWNGKFLSRAGKEVLLKFVIQSLPTYAMSVFLIPLETCQEIEKIMANFWWKTSSAKGQGIFWMSWDAWLLINLFELYLECTKLGEAGLSKNYWQWDYNQHFEAPLASRSRKPDYSLVNDMFNPRDAHLILGIPLSSIPGRRRWSWKVTKQACLGKEIFIPTQVLNSAWTTRPLALRFQDKSSLLSLSLLQHDNNIERWTKPDSDTVKLNVDGALFEKENAYGFGIVARDLLGRLVDLKAKYHGGNYPAEVVEALGIKEALSRLKDKEWNQVDIETNSMITVQAIFSNQHMTSAFGLIVNEL
uniref:Uncharacterized protein n=1 Tax=Cannabis sativa TaxID=3483 RepID=A0A803P703_CANSA